MKNQAEVEVIQVEIQSVMRILEVLEVLPEDHYLEALEYWQEMGDYQEVRGLYPDHYLFLGCCFSLCLYLPLARHPLTRHLLVHHRDGVYCGVFA
jgi:hypothetical protein